MRKNLPVLYVPPIGKCDPEKPPPNERNSIVNDQNVAPWRTEAEVASFLGVSKKWLQKMRYTGGGIPFLKIGNGIVRYRTQDILEFEQKHLKNNSSEYTQK